MSDNPYFPHLFSSLKVGERTLRTRDLGGNADTSACGKAVADMVE